MHTCCAGKCNRKQSRPWRLSNETFRARQPRCAHMPCHCDIEMPRFQCMSMPCNYCSESSHRTSTPQACTVARIVGNCNKAHVRNCDRIFVQSVLAHPIVTYWQHVSYRFLGSRACSHAQLRMDRSMLPLLHIIVQGVHCFSPH